MIALDYREPRPCCVRLSLLHVLLLLPSLLHPPVHRSGVNLCPNLIIHICQPASCNVSHSLSLSLSPSLERLVATREEGRGEKNKHPAPRKWGYITININGSPVSSNFQPPPPLLPPRESGAISSASKCFDRSCLSDRVPRNFAYITEEEEEEEEEQDLRASRSKNPSPIRDAIQLTLRQDLSRCTDRFLFSKKR